MSERRKTCQKMESGNCEGCPVFDHAVRLIELTVPWQEVMDHIEKTECPTGISPTIKDVKENGVATKTIEGKIVYIAKSQA